MSSLEVPPPLQGVRRIVCLGDSITEGGEARGGYVWLLRQALKEQMPKSRIKVFNAGISGHRSNDMLARFDRDVLRRKPDLVTISVGVNDVWHGFDGTPNGDGPNGIPLSDYRRNVEAMVKKAMALGVRVVILSGTPIYEDFDSPENLKAEGYNLALREIASATGSLFVEYQAAFRAAIGAHRQSTGAVANVLTTDGVHMNAAGNALMARELLAVLGL